MLSCAKPSRQHNLVVPSVEYSNFITGRLERTAPASFNQQVPSTYNGYQVPQNIASQKAFKQNPLGQKPSVPTAQPAQYLKPEAGIPSLPSRVNMTAEEMMAAYNGYQYETNMAPGLGAQELNPGDYNGPLSLGDPGVTASLWRDSSNTPDFFRDARAFRPMDLITVEIKENTEGSKEADTEIKSQSTLRFQVENLLGYEDEITASNPNINLDDLINAQTQNDFKGEGDTTRKGDLKGTISCMVMELLPSGILRIEGTKIISVNNEEQIMVLSGLVRPRDISSDNKVESSRLANMRIDYYGQGQLGEAQHEGWLGHILRKIWPF